MDALAGSPKVTVEWELATRLAGNANAPRQAILSVFRQIMDDIAQSRGRSIDERVKWKVWIAISPMAIHEAQLTLIAEVVGKILMRFKKTALEEMLQRHKAAGTIDQPHYERWILANYHEYYSRIIEAVKKTAALQAQAIEQTAIRILETEDQKAS